MRLLVHDIAAAQPAEVDVVTLIFVTLYLKETLLAILVISCSSRSDTKVPVEIIIIQEIGAN
jgi:hypothetical protein